MADITMTETETEVFILKHGTNRNGHCLAKPHVSEVNNIKLPFIFLNLNYQKLTVVTFSFYIDFSI